MCGGVKLSCLWSDGGRGRDLGSLRRSPLGAIMNQIRRKRSFTDKKPLGRFLSWSSEKIPEDGESGAATPTGGLPCEGPQLSTKLRFQPGFMQLVERITFNIFSHRRLCACVAAVAVAAEGEPELGWGRVRIFLHRLGKTVDSRSLDLAHCDLTATDLLELGD